MDHNNPTGNNSKNSTPLPIKNERYEMESDLLLIPKN